MSKSSPENSVNANKAAAQNVIRIPFGNLKIFNQHDTPPSTLFMEGSCIMELKYLEGEAVPDDITFEEFLNMLQAGSAGSAKEEQPYIGHIKIVDGSGEMQYRFDNNNKESIALALAISQGGQPIGDFDFAVVEGNWVIRPPGDTKIEHRPGDEAMSKERIRFRCLDTGNGDVEITGVRIDKVTPSGRIPVYASVFRDLKKEGAELKVMLWFEPHEDDNT